MREGIETLIGRTSDCVVVGSAGTYEDGLELVRVRRPDLVLLDLSLPDGNGLQLIERIDAELRDTHIIVLTMHARRQIADRAIAAGAAGYLLKESSGELLIKAMRRVVAGETVLDPALLSPAAEEDYTDVPEHDGTRIRRLSSREAEVFALLAVGRSVKEIACMLGISPKTVDNHRARVMEKLHAKSVAEIVRIAIRTGTIEP